jgi:hypothetical protein
VLTHIECSKPLMTQEDTIEGVKRRCGFERVGANIGHSATLTWEGRNDR